VHTAKAFSIGRSIILPAELASHEVTRLKVRMTRLEHLPDSKGLHDIAKRNRRLVGVARHPGALRGTEPVWWLEQIGYKRCKEVDDRKHRIG
jgi:hypothetical protein